MLTLEGTAIYCDVDDTLIFWQGNTSQPYEGCVTVYDPFLGIEVYGTPNLELIEKLRKQKQEDNYSIVIWSQQGEEWAHAAVIALGLEDIVDLCIAKPFRVYDDIPLGAQGWKFERIYPKEII